MLSFACYALRRSLDLRGLLPGPLNCEPGPPCLPPLLGPDSLSVANIAVEGLSGRSRRRPRPMRLSAALLTSTSCRHS